MGLKIQYILQREYEQKFINRFLIFEGHVRSITKVGKL